MFFWKIQFLRKKAQIMKINIEHAYKKYESDLLTIIKRIDGQNNLNLLLQSVEQLEEEPKNELLPRTKTNRL